MRESFYQNGKTGEWYDNGLHGDISCRYDGNDETKIKSEIVSEKKCEVAMIINLNACSLFDRFKLRIRILGWIILLH